MPTINMESVKKIMNGNKRVKKIEDSNSNLLWKGYWEYTIKLGSYVSVAKYSVDNTNWTDISSNTKVTVYRDETLYIQAKTYSSEPTSYQYSYSMSDNNFNITRSYSNDDGEVTISRTATPATNTYSLSASCTNASWVKFYSDSSRTNQISSASYGSTVYYYCNGNTGYTDKSGSLTVNENDFSLNIGNLTASVDLGSLNVDQFTLTISAQNTSYGTYSVTRTSSQLAGALTGALSNGATIYYGDVLEISSSANNPSSWSISSVSAPTLYSTTGDATTGNLILKNNDDNSADIYYNTSNSTGGTSLGSISSNSTVSVSGLSFGTTYYASARRYRTRTIYSNNSSHPSEITVTNNVSLSFSFDTGTEGEYIWSSTTSVATASRNAYTISFVNSYDSSQNQSSSVYWGETPSYSGTPTRSADNYNTYSFNGWDSSITAVTGNKTYTATWKPSTREYTSNVYLGSYCSQIRAKVGSGSWTSWSSSTITLSHTYNQTIYWEATAYSTSSSYTYRGATSGSFNGSNGNSYTVKFTQVTSPQRSNFSVSLYLYYDSDDGEYDSAATIKNNYDDTITIKDIRYYNSSGSIIKQYNNQTYTVNSGSSITIYSGYDYKAWYISFRIEYKGYTFNYWYFYHDQLSDYTEE